MKIQIDYLKTFINLEDPSLIQSKATRSEKQRIWKEVFASVGMETDEIIDFKDQDVFDIAITPNRPDWLSHYGMARDLHARLPELEFHKPEISSRSFEIENEPFFIHIEDKLDCERYCGCIVRDIEVGESPDEVKHLLESLGLRPINSIVDISNLIVVTIGHPIHMFDLDKLSGNELHIRRARNGERISLLNEQEVDLDEDFLVIADSTEPVALAGIMGGEDSGVSASTRNILIESAHFNPRVIRKAARKIGLSSDASFRFERGADIAIAPDAINMALDMIQKSASQPLNITYYSDQFPAGFEAQVVELEKRYSSLYSGIEIEEKICARILKDLGFSLTAKNESWIVKVPSYRVDIYGKQDLVEEITRIHGYDRLKAEIPTTSNLVLDRDYGQELHQKIRYHLTSVGFDESINYVFHGPEEFDLINPGSKAVIIRNPLGKDYSVLRQSLLPGLLKNMALNFNHNFHGVHLFEIGQKFQPAEDEVKETQYVSVCASGEYIRSNWKQQQAQPMDFFQFKSLILSLFRRLSIPVDLDETSMEIMEEGCCFSIHYNNNPIGYIGMLKKSVTDWYKIETPVMAAEINIDTISISELEGGFDMWNKFPSYKRDISFLMDRKTGFRKLEKSIQTLKPDSLESFHLFDRYRGEGIPDDKVSLSMTFSYTDETRTLTTEEINRMHNDFMKRLINKFNLIQR